jgi:hypothetical protein
LIRNQCNAAHDEQHGTGILRDFKARVFHSTLILFLQGPQDLRTFFFLLFFPDFGDASPCSHVRLLI